MKAGLVQQVGSPTEIYDTPANTFVASFIGNPAMNLIDGAVKDGVFTAKGTTVPGLTADDGPMTLGYRAEDASLAYFGQGQINAAIQQLTIEKRLAEQAMGEQSTEHHCHHRGHGIFIGLGQLEHNQ